MSFKNVIDDDLHDMCVGDAETILRQIFSKVDDQTKKPVGSKLRTMAYHMSYQFPRPDVAVEVVSFLSTFGIDGVEASSESMPNVYSLRVADLLDVGISIAEWSIENHKDLHANWIPPPGQDAKSMTFGQSLYSKLI